MTQRTSGTNHAHRHRWRRDVVELAALFVAVATADVAAKMIVRGPEGPQFLIISAVVLLITVAFHTWWARRHSHSPPAAQPAPVGEPEQDIETTLWRMRTTVSDVPGSLAALCTALARVHADILTLQTHPLSDGTVDEFLVRAPASLAAQEFTAAVAAAGGRDTWIERADAHDLVDTPTRVLSLATKTALDAAELPLALRQLLGRCSIRSEPGDPGQGRHREDWLDDDGTTMHLGDASGGSITVRRPYLPFTPTEFARARALVDLDARLGPRLPSTRDVLTLPAGNEITIRRAGPDDLHAALGMHRRCSAATLRDRYHGPCTDADRYLTHLLSPRFGQTLAAETATGRTVALAHLLWDGEETEVALLVEDAWQRRGVGLALLRRLVALAGEAGCASVYAVTQSTNTGMVAAMRRLALPLDYQIEDGTLVITARLVATPELSPVRSSAGN